MSGLARLVWFVLHLVLAAVAVPWLALTRRGAVLVFTHVQDVDETGVDRQMGPLIERLRSTGRPFVEWTLAPLDRRAARQLARTRRPFVPHAAVLGPARLLSVLPGLDRDRLRERLASWVLAALRPRVAYLIDESGSGQTLVHAARRRGVRTIGVQHGDFQASNAQYAAPRSGVRAADLMAVWSPWFAARLHAVSPLYDASNTRVVGRLRCEEAGGRRADGQVHVLLVADSGHAFVRAVEPFVAALRAAGDLDLLVRAHPGDDDTDWPERSGAGLTRDLDAADVVLGSGSSALLEALHRRRPIVVLVTPELGDPAGYAREELGPACAEPGALPDLCRALARAPADALVGPRERVWGGAPQDAAAALLALEDER